MTTPILAACAVTPIEMVDVLVRDEHNVDAVMDRRVRQEPQAAQRPH
jgi:hypothetical protein